MRHLLILSLFVAISLFAALFVFLQKDPPEGYEFLFFLPFSFALVSLLFNKLYRYIPDNLAISLMIFLFFCRMVLSPCALCLGNYTATINLDVKYNLFHAIMLMVYELVMVFATLFFVNQSKQSKIDTVINGSLDSLSISTKRKYAFCILISLVILSVCFYVSPFLKEMYRPITKIGDELFANYEDSLFIAEYAKSFVIRFTMVVGMYFMRAMLIIFPAFVIVCCSEYKNAFSRIISLLCCVLPLFFIDGVIARSLIYAICLFLLRERLFNTNKMERGIIFAGVMGVGAVLLWWNYFYVNTTLTMYESMSGRLSAYFSSVNNIAGVFNLPNDLGYRIKYFFYDFMLSIPFGHTIFGINDFSVSEFFNYYNHTKGQIPTTIGMGYFYFGDVFAPLYSMLFAYLAYVSFFKLKNSSGNNPFQYIRYLYSTFVFCMGVVMYNISITMVIVFGILIPMYILERLTSDSKLICRTNIF